MPENMEATTGASDIQEAGCLSDALHWLGRDRQRGSVSATPTLLRTLATTQIGLYALPMA